jgi:hypothetical protein
MSALNFPSYQDALFRFAARREQDRLAWERMRQAVEADMARMAAVQKLMYAPDRIDLGVWPFCRCLDPIVFGHRKSCSGPLAGVRE